MQPSQCSLPPFGLFKFFNLLSFWKCPKNEILRPTLVIGLDLAVLSLANHTIMDYGTFGLWAGLFAGGTIIAPTGYTKGSAMSPDLVWWHAANMTNVELVDINTIEDE